MGAWINFYKANNSFLFLNVAPFMGAWIENPMSKDTISQLVKSHPLWVRGLKLLLSDLYYSSVIVAPFMGAWINFQLILNIIN